MSGNVARPAKALARSSQTEAMVAALTELAARAGHDMVGPLNQAGSLLALFIKRYQGNLDDDADQLLGFLQSASVRMEGLLEGLRSYMQAVGRMPEAADVDLNESLSGARARLQKKIADTGAAIEADDLPRARADKEHLIFVFEQLLDNALKFCKTGESPRVRVSHQKDGELIAISVVDQGIGINPEQRDAVFLPFKRLNGREFPGPGLGLAAVKAVVEMNGGRVRVASPAGADSTIVEFTVPQ